MLATFKEGLSGDHPLGSMAALRGKSDALVQKLEASLSDKVSEASRAWQGSSHELAEVQKMLETALASTKK